MQALTPSMDLNAWLATAQPGAQIVYFRGHLPRGPSATVLDKAAADAAWQAHAEGRAFLTQKRVRSGHVDGAIGAFDYICTKAA